MLVPLMDERTWNTFNEYRLKYRNCFSRISDSYQNSSFDELVHDFNAIFDIFKDTKCVLVPQNVCKTLYFAYLPTCGMRALNKIPPYQSYVHRVNKNTLNIVSYDTNTKEYECGAHMPHSFGNEAVKEVAACSILTAVSEIVPHSNVYGEVFSNTTLYMLTCLHKKYNELCIYAKFIGRELPDYESRFSIGYGSRFSIGSA